MKLSVEAAFQDTHISFLWTAMAKVNRVRSCVLLRCFAKRNKIVGCNVICEWPTALSRYETVRLEHGNVCLEIIRLCVHV